MPENPAPHTACGGCGDAAELKRRIEAQLARADALTAQAVQVRNEYEALRREEVGPPPDSATLTPFSEVQRERVDWLPGWEGRIPVGMLTMLMGDPGLGKSLLSVMLAAEVSQAGRDAILASAEDHPAAVIRPRLEVANADLERVHAIKVQRDGVEEGIVLPDDAPILDGLVLSTRAQLLVVDPLSAHLGDKVNSWRDQSMRSALGPLHRIAERRGCAVVVIAHLNKGKGSDALYRTGGSIGLPGAVRSALLLARDPSDPAGERGPRRVLAHVKCNVGKRVESLVAEAGVELLDGDEVGCLRITGTSTASTADLLDQPDHEERTQRDEATDFLVAELAAGARPVEDIQAAAKAAGISWRTIQRAKKSLGVESARASTGNDGKGRWEWSLATPPLATPPLPYLSSGSLAENGLNKPDDEGADSQHRHTRDMAPLP